MTDIDINTEILLVKIDQEDLRYLLKINYLRNTHGYSVAE